MKEEMAEVEAKKALPSTPSLGNCNVLTTGEVTPCERPEILKVMPGATPMTGTGSPESSDSSPNSDGTSSGNDSNSKKKSKLKGIEDTRESTKTAQVECVNKKIKLENITHAHIKATTLLYY